MRLLEGERAMSFFVTGGLVAVHAAGRDRLAIWDALKTREVYATSGPRILLWFDLIDDDGRLWPMGSEVEVASRPRFRVRTAGAFEQMQGCPEHSSDALAPGRLARLCRGQCYNPGPKRRTIERLEVVRIRRIADLGGALADLIEDPWLVVDCPGAGVGCIAEFEDPSFDPARETIYYVRVFQESEPTVNAGALRCRYDTSGGCAATEPCYGDYRTDRDDDCLAAARPRAWSSPIYVHGKGSR
jgi:hypothetical protein